MLRFWAKSVREGQTTSGDRQKGQVEGETKAPQGAAATARREGRASPAQDSRCEVKGVTAFRLSRCTPGDNAWEWSAAANLLELYTTSGQGVKGGQSAAEARGFRSPRLKPMSGG